MNVLLNSLAVPYVCNSNDRHSTLEPFINHMVLVLIFHGILKYVYLFLPQLGLVDATSNWKKWQRGYCYVHRGIIFTLLVFTCAIQVLVCFRRDGFVGSLSRSNQNDTICNVERHVIISNLMQEVLVITAYVLLLWYTTKWQREKNDLVSGHL